MIIDTNARDLVDQPMTATEKKQVWHMATFDVNAKRRRFFNKTLKHAPFVKLVLVQYLVTMYPTLQCAHAAKKLQ